MKLMLPDIRYRLDQDFVYLEQRSRSGKRYPIELGRWQLECLLTQMNECRDDDETNELGDGRPAQ